MSRPALTYDVSLPAKLGISQERFAFLDKTYLDRMADKLPSEVILILNDDVELDYLSPTEAIWLAWTFAVVGTQRCIKDELIQKN